MTSASQANEVPVNQIAAYIARELTTRQLRHYLELALRAVIPVLMRQDVNSRR